jgi:ribonuclease P protein component
MFPKEHRFSFKNKLPTNKFNSPSFTVRYGENDGGLKIAVVVPKRVDKRATVRNRIKRKVLGAVRKFVKEDLGLTLVFYLKKNSPEQELENEVFAAVQKFNV